MRRMIGSKTKSAFFLFFFLFLVLSILAAYASWTYYRQVSSDMSAHAARMTKLISRLCANVLLAQDFTQLDQILENVLQYDDVLSIKFVDRQGATVRERIKASDQQEFIEVKEALPAPAEAAGSIIVRFSTERIQALKAQYLRQKAVEVVLGAGGASLLLLLILNRLVSRPLHTLAQKMKNVADSEGIPQSLVLGENGFVSVEKALTSLSDHLRGMRTRADALSSGISHTKSQMVSLSREVTLKGDAHRAAVAETSLTAHALNNAIPGMTASTEKLAELAEKSAVFIVEMNTSMAMISDRSEVFHESAQETASSIEEMIASIKQIAENLNVLNSSAENTSSSITEITASVKQIEEGAAESVALADKVNEEAAQKGMTALHAAMQGMADIKSHMDDLSKVINALGKRSKEIEGILTVISDVTDETNLLSLNAAILAAQAGESGRAFSVVAAEIRGLADRTALSTKEISALIKSVQDQTRSSVTTAAGVMEAVEKGSVLFKDVKDVLNHIIESSSASTNMAQSIQKAAAEEVSAIRHIADAMVKISEQINQISSATAEQSKGSKFILEAAEKVRTASFEVKRAVEAEYGETKGMTAVIQDVGFMALQIADDIKGQKQQSAEVVLRLEKLAQEAKELLRLTRELDAAADASKTEA